MKSMAILGAALGVLLNGCTGVDSPATMSTTNFLGFTNTRICELSEAELSFDGVPGPQTIHSEFLTILQAPDKNLIQIANRATGCRDTLQSKAGPMEMDLSVNIFRATSDDFQDKIYHRESYDYKYCQQKLDEGDELIGGYMASFDEQRRRQQASGPPGLVIDYMEPCWAFVFATQLPMFVSDGLHSIIYVSTREAVHFQEIQDTNAP